MPVLLVSLLTLGAVGLYLAMPGGRLNVGRAALLLLIGAAAVLVAWFTPRSGAGAERAWFIAFSLIGLLGSIRMITHRKPVYSALYFVLVVVAVTGLLVLLAADFLAAALLIIYAGAILVTYVFVIMLAQQEGEPRYDREAREPFFGVLAGFILLALISGRVFVPVDAEPAVGAAAALTGESVALLGTSLFTRYALALQLAGVLLLAAMVGAIAIARRRAYGAEGGEC